MRREKTAANEALAEKHLQRRASLFNTARIDHIYQDPHSNHQRLRLHYGDLTDSSNLTRILSEVQPDEVYNLGAQSHVAVSFEEPEYTADVDAIGTLRLLEAIRFLGRYARQGMVNHLDKATAVVVPSRVRESFGRVANEALQCGVPVVVPAGGGMAEQVRPGWNGLLFERGDVRDLARVLQRLIDGETALRPRASWPHASTAEGELTKLCELYRSLL